MATASAGAKKAKNKEAAARNRAAALNPGEPVIRKDSYDRDLSDALAFYSNFIDAKKLREWFKKYLAKRKDVLEKFALFSDFDIRQVAILSRLHEREQPLKPEHVKLIETKINELMAKAKYAKSDSEDEEAPQAKPKLTVLERIQLIANDHIEFIDYEIDKCLVAKKFDFDPATYMKAQAINGPTAKAIAPYFEKALSEVVEAIGGECEQLVEGYSYLTKPQLRKYKEMLEKIVDACAQRKVAVVRAPRKKKVRLPADIVKRVKWQPEFKGEGLELKSEHPTKMVDATEIWLYNTKTRRMSVMRSIDKDVLIVKGTSIINFDTYKSETRTIRNPDEFFKTKLAKRELNAAWKALKTKPVAAKGRINEDTIIVATF